MSQLLVGKDPVAADVEKYQSIAVALMLEKPVRLCQSPSPTTPPIALPQRRVLTATLSLAKALQQIRQTTLQTLCECKPLTMIRSL